MPSTPIQTSYKRIITLDMATKTGWTFHDGTHTESGVETFELARGESNGWRFIRFRQFLEKFPPADLVVWEQAFHRGGAPTELAIGMVACVLVFAAERNMLTKPCNNKTLKKWVTGNGNADKQLMGIVARERWQRTFQDDNECDAYCLLMWALAGCPESEQKPTKKRRAPLKTGTGGLLK